MLRVIAGLSTLCAVALVSAGAHAKVMSVTFRGEMDGYDAVGFVGGGMLYDAEPFAVQLTYDTSRGYRTDFGGAGEFLGGGTGSGSDGPFLSAVLTVEGRTTDLARAFNGTAETYGPAYVHEFADRYPGQLEFNITDAASAGPFTTFFNFWIGGFGAAKASLETPWSGPLTGGYGTLEGGIVQPGASALFSLNLTPTDVRFEATPSPTPEPGAWALMLLGFGAVGAAVRRQSRWRAPSAASPSLGRAGFAIAAISVASLGAGAADAATLVQSQSFSIFHVANLATSGAGVELRDKAFGGVENRTLSFQGFDQALGTLRGVRFDLGSDLTLSYGVFIAQVGAVSIEGGLLDEVRVGGVSMGRFARPIFISCGAASGGCLLTETKSAEFDLTDVSAPLAPFLQGGPVSVDLASELDLTLVLSRLFGDARATTTQSWAGQVNLSYDYDPAPAAVVPEPETWALAVLGFGLAGAALRSSRAVRRPNPM